MGLNPVTEIAGAIRELAKVVGSWIENSEPRRMRKAIRIGDEIIDRIRELSIIDKDLNKLMDKYQKYNN